MTEGVRGRRECRELLESLGNLDTETIRETDWRDFEGACAGLLSENGYRAQRNVWFSTPDRRYQIDVVGLGLRRVICIDCKAWTTGGGSSRSRSAVRDQKERTVQFKRWGSHRGIADAEKAPFYPLIVTLRNEDLVLHRGVAVVPFEMLNRFLLDFHRHEAGLFSA